MPHRLRARSLEGTPADKRGTAAREVQFAAWPAALRRQQTTQSGPFTQEPDGMLPSNVAPIADAMGVPVAVAVDRAT